MKALTWQGRRHVSVEEVPDPVLRAPNDAIIRVTSTAICGSDLHLYDPLAPFLDRGDVLGHEAMGIVEEVGSEAGDLAVGDRVVVPFNISCGHCWMCRRGLYAQCETTQVVGQGKGAALFGYTRLYGSVPGGQAEYLRVPQAQFGPIKVSPDGPDERFLYLSDILPTAKQALAWADVPADGSLVVVGLGPVGQLTVRLALHQGLRVIGIESVPDRLATAAAAGAETVPATGESEVVAAVLDLTSGRGADSSVDAVGMEAHGSPLARVATTAGAMLPGAVGRPLAERFAVDAMTAFRTAVGSTRRGGTVSVSGVYGGAVDPVALVDIFDRGLTLRFGQCHVRRWADELLELLAESGDTLGLEQLATHRLPLTEAPQAYRMFQEKTDGCLKVVLKP